jgi:hypothetical protein
LTQLPRYAKGCLDELLIGSQLPPEQLQQALEDYFVLERGAVPLCQSGQVEAPLFGARAEQFETVGEAVVLEKLLDGVFEGGLNVRGRQRVARLRLKESDGAEEVGAGDFVLGIHALATPSSHHG